MCRAVGHRGKRNYFWMELLQRFGAPATGFMKNGEAWMCRAVSHRAREIILMDSCSSGLERSDRN